MKTAGAPVPAAETNHTSDVVASDPRRESAGSNRLLSSHSTWSSTLRVSASRDSRPSPKIQDGQSPHATRPVVETLLVRDLGLIGRERDGHSAFVRNDFHACC
jgi:hypothetical protein